VLRFRAKSDYRYLPLGLALVICERRIEGGLLLVESVMFDTHKLVSSNPKGVIADLYLDIRVSFQVMVPIWMRRSASLGCEDDIAVAILEIHDGDNVGLPCPSPPCVKKHQRRSFEVAPNFSMIAPELCYRVGVEVLGQVIPKTSSLAKNLAEWLHG